MLFCIISVSASFCHAESDDASEENEPPLKEQIVQWRKQINDGPADRDRGVAVANLVDIASRLSRNANNRQSALDLLNNDVLTHVNYTKSVEETSACHWRNVLYRCYGIYSKLQDRAGQEKCLELIKVSPTNQDDKWFVIYLQSFLHADYGEYSKAIATMQKIPQGNQYANRREQHISYWKELLRKNGDKLPPKKAK